MIFADKKLRYDLFQPPHFYMQSDNRMVDIDPTGFSMDMFILYEYHVDHGSPAADHL